MKKESHGNSQKIKRIIVILLAVLLLVTAFAYGFMLGTKYADKNNTIKDDNNEIVDDEEDKENEVTEETVTKEDIENFLLPLVSGNPNYNLLLPTNSDDYNDEIIFISAIKYLLANNKYSKSNDNYLFKQSDIKDVAKKYLIKDNFDYIPASSQFTYDSSSKTFSSTLQFDIYGFNAVVTKKLANYNVDGNTINANYQVTIAYPHPETGELGTGITYSYAITLERIDSELRIINVVKN